MQKTTLTKLVQSIFTAIVFTLSFSNAASAQASDDSRQQIKKKIIQVALNNHIDPDFILAMAFVESGFDPYAISHKGAEGLFQIMPATQQTLNVNYSFDIEQNTQGAIDYLKQLLARFKNVKLSLMAYNAGPTRVAKENIPTSSVRYADKVVKVYRQYKLARKRMALMDKVREP